MLQTCYVRAAAAAAGEHDEAQASCRLYRSAAAFYLGPALPLPLFASLRLIAANETVYCPGPPFLPSLGEYAREM